MSSQAPSRQKAFLKGLYGMDMKEPETGDQITVKKACISCGREFAEDVSVCPEDQTPLTSLAQERDIGSIIADRYEILGIVGRGGMGRVYKARHRLMKRIVAIKMLYPNLVSTAAMLRRFQQEAQATSTLNHPNILTVHDFGLTDDGQPYLVMDFLEGTSLGEVLQKEGSLSYGRLQTIFVQASAALAHAHQKGVIHRDLKPSNFMLVDFDGKHDFVKIVDFGIAKILDTDPPDAEPLTRTGEVFGSPMYMSPEQCRGELIDFRCDIYSLGCVMYRAATGLTPFTARDQLECMFKQVNEEPGRFSNVCPDLILPDELEAVVFKALEKKSQDRYQSMSDLKAALEALRIEPASINESTSKSLTSKKISLLKEQTCPSAGQNNVLDAGSRRRLRKLIDWAGQAVPVFHRNKLWLVAAAALSGIALAAFLFSKYMPGSRHATTQIQQHGAGSAVVNPVKSGQADSLLKAAQQAAGQGNFNKAEHYARQAMLSSAMPQPAADKPYSASLNYLGYLAYMKGQYVQSSSYLLKALRLRQKCFGDKSAEVAETKTLLGRAWSATAQYSQAEIFLQQALAARIKLFGKDDLLVADTLSALADVALRQRKLHDAQALLERALTIREIALGQDDPAAATAMMDLGQVYQIENKDSEALSLYNQALKVRKSKLAANDPLIADTYFCLGTLKERQEQFSQARQLFEGALVIEQNALGQNSPASERIRQALDNLNSRSAGQ